MSLRNPNVYRVLLIAVNSCLIVYIVRIGERGGEGGRERQTGSYGRIVYSVRTSSGGQM